MHGWKLMSAVAATASLVACGGGSDSTTATNEALVAPAFSSVTSYAAAKESSVGPIAMPDRYALARVIFAIQGEVVVFSATQNYQPGTSTPTTAPPSTFAIYRAYQDGAVTKDSALFPVSDQGCIHPRKAVAADFNGDGVTDVFVACHGFDASPFPGETNKVVLSQPGGTYLIQDANPATGFFHSATAADFNQDGHVDVVTTNNMSNPSIQIWLNDGQGQFTATTQQLPSALNGQANYFTIDLPDVNGDGLFDLFVAGHEWEIPGTFVYLNPGNNDFTAVQPTLLPSVTNEGVVLDVIANTSSQQKTLWLLRTSGGDSTFYQSLVLQKINWATLSSEIVVNQRPAQWLPWIVPNKAGTAIVSDDANVTTLNAAY